VQAGIGAQIRMICSRGCLLARIAAAMRGRRVRVRALSSRAERGVLRAEADSAADALIFPSDGDRARASGWKPAERSMLGPCRRPDSAEF